MSIKSWPTTERPRERLLNNGAASLSDAELLAIFLRTGVAGQSAVALSRQLLGQFGSLDKLVGASPESFCAGHGLGLAKYAQLQAVMELARRCLAQRAQHEDALTSPQAARNYVQAHLQGKPEEVFAALYLNNRHQPLAFEELFHGTINSASIYPRVLVRRALAHNAAAVIVAHNHPSGVAEPSPEDRAITEKIKQALALVDVRLLDHLVVGHGTIVAFSERGFI